GIGRRRGAGCSGALEGPDDNHAATATRAWRAMVCCGAGGWVRLVALHRRIGHRHGHCDQFSGTRDILLAGGAGEQPVVTDAVEPLWQEVEQEAPDELVGGRASWCATAPGRRGGSPCSGRSHRVRRGRAGGYWRWRHGECIGRDRRALPRGRRRAVAWRRGTISSS